MTVKKLFRKRRDLTAENVSEWGDPNMQRRGRLGVPASHEFHSARMKSLRDLGVSYAAIATVMNFDFPDYRYTADQVRFQVLAARRDERYP
jgi:hypothetical protein